MPRRGRRPLVGSGTLTAAEGAVEIENAPMHTSHSCGEKVDMI